MTRVASTLRAIRESQLAGSAPTLSSSLVKEPPLDQVEASSSEVIVGLSADSRQEVDELLGKVVAGGGKDLGGDDHGFMYMRGFQDPDGHQWSFIYMDMSAASGQ